MTRAAHRPRRTTMVPVTTMEEVPVLEKNERDELLRQLEESQAEVERGEAADFDAKAFGDRLMRIQAKKRGDR